MIKGLQALKVLVMSSTTIFNTKEQIDESVKTIEKELKALEIIKSKKWLVDIILGYCAGCDSVNKTATYDLLKEVLSDEA